MEQQKENQDKELSEQPDESETDSPSKSKVVVLGDGHHHHKKLPKLHLRETKHKLPGDNIVRFFSKHTVRASYTQYMPFVRPDGIKVVFKVDKKSLKPIYHVSIST